MARSLRVLVSCIAIGLFAAPAGAQLRQQAGGKQAAGAGQRAPEIVADDGESYEVKFDDELLDGAGIDGTLAIIRVMPRPVRSTLIRPRTHFVPELLKSVERI
jgi:hypothetical protein